MIEFSSRARHGCPSWSIVQGLLAAFASAACGAADGGEIGSNAEQPGNLASPTICGDPDLQHVESFSSVEGVSQAFVLEHDGPVGSYGCSGTLIGDGLFITAAHCDSSGLLGGSVKFNHQLDPDGEPRDTESFWISQRVEKLGNDHMLLRLHHQPDTRWGSAALTSTMPSEGDVLTIIGHPGTDGDYKKVEAGVAHTVTSGEVRYERLDTLGGVSGSGILDTTGKLVGVHRAGSGCDGEVANVGNIMARIYGTSEFVQGSRGSGRHYTFLASGERELRWNRPNWRSSYRGVVAGRFTSAVNEQLFFYDSATGTGHFEEVTVTAMNTIGSFHEGLRKSWTLIVPCRSTAHLRTSSCSTTRSTATVASIAPTGLAA